MEYEVLFSVDGWGRTYISAATEDEAIQKFENGDWVPDKEDNDYQWQDIKPAD